jgi:hypothetical protein
MILMLNFMKTDQKLPYHTHADDPPARVNGEQTEAVRPDAEHTSTYSVGQSDVEQRCGQRRKPR